MNLISGVVSKVKAGMVERQLSKIAGKKVPVSQSPEGLRIIAMKATASALSQDVLQKTQSKPKSGFAQMIDNLVKAFAGNPSK